MPRPWCHTRMPSFGSMKAMAQALTGAAQVLLVLTSIAPVGLVYAGVLLDAGEYQVAAGTAVTSLALALGCSVLLRRTGSSVAAVPRRVGDLSPRSGDSLSFLVGYALPLLAMKNPTSVGLAGVAAFIGIVGLTAWQQQVFHINPLMSLLGFRFFSAKNDSGGHVLVITKMKVIAPGTLPIVKVSEYLWLHVPIEGRGVKNEKPGSHPHASP